MKKLSLKQVYLNELEKVDEPEGGPFGKVLFSPDRNDKVEEEENTKVENDFFWALDLHFDNEGSNALKKILPYISKLIKQGKYEQFLKPPEGYAYRFLNNIPISVASKFLGLDKSELLKGAQKAWYIETNAKLKPKNKAGVQSWTTKPNVNALYWIGVQTKTLDSNRVAILLETHTRAGGHFFLNPSLTSKIEKWQNYTNESEVISLGPVKLIGASYFVNTIDPKKFRKVETGLTKLEKLINRELRKIERPDPDTKAFDRYIDKLERQILKHYKIFEKEFGMGEEIIDSYHDSIAHDFAENGKPIKLKLDKTELQDTLAEEFDMKKILRFLIQALGK